MRIFDGQTTGLKQHKSSLKQHTSGFSFNWTHQQMVATKEKEGAETTPNQGPSCAWGVPVIIHNHSSGVSIKVISCPYIPSSVGWNPILISSNIRCFHPSPAPCGSSHVSPGRKSWNAVSSSCWPQGESYPFFLAGRACKIKQMVSRCSCFFLEGENDVELLKNS